MSSRTVNCVKLGAESPGLERPPFPGELGQQIYEQISQEAWDSWVNDWMIKVINEYRLNMAEDKDYFALVDHMREYFNLQAEPGESS